MMRAVSRQSSLTIQFLDRFPGRNQEAYLLWLGEVRAGMLRLTQTLNCLVTLIPWR